MIVPAATYAQDFTWALPSLNGRRLAREELAHIPSPLVSKGGGYLLSFPSAPSADLQLQPIWTE